MPLPELRFITDEELEELLLGYLEGRDSVSWQEVSENVVIVRSIGRDVLRVTRAFQRVKLKFDQFSNRYVRGEPPIMVDKYTPIRVRLRSYVIAAKEAKRARDDKAISELGCTTRQLRRYLEGRMLEGMTWDNLGSWHVGYIRELWLFDLRDKEQYKKACHWSNLRPVWGAEP